MNLSLRKSGLVRLEMGRSMEEESSVAPRSGGDEQEGMKSALSFSFLFRRSSFRYSESGISVSR